MLDINFFEKFMYRATKKILLLSGVLYFILLNNFTAGELLKEHLTGLNCQRSFPSGN